ncbi:MAG: caspase family protein [Myxococcota bacterium]
MTPKPVRLVLPVLLALATAATAYAVKEKPLKGKNRTVGISYGNDAQGASPGGPPRKALVIGNSNYPGSPLPNTKRDARDVGKALEDLGFTVHSASDLDLKAFRRASGAFVDDINKGDIVFVFYAGHGIEIDGTNYLVPVDFSAQRASDVAYEAFPLNQLLDGIQQQHPAVTVVVLDACRNNPFLANRSFGKRGLAQVNAGEGSLIAYATSPGKTASDGAENSNGVFTASLVKYLRKPGVDIEGVFKEVSDDVAIKTNREQIPWRSSSIVGKFYLAGDAPEEEEQPKAKRVAARDEEEEAEQPALGKEWGKGGAEEEEAPPPQKGRPGKGKGAFCWEDVVRKTWLKGGTSVMAFVQDGQPHLIGYDGTTGATVFARVRDDGELPEQVWSGKWKKGWKGFMPFTLKEKPHFFLYNPESGQAQYEEVNPGAQDSTTRKYGSWRAGFTHFGHAGLVGHPSFSGYVGGKGELVMWAVDELYNDPNLSEGNIGIRGLAAVQVFVLEQAIHVLLYDAATGKTVVARATQQGEASSVIEGEMEKGWAWFGTLYVEGEHYLAAYRPEDGVLAVLKPHGKSLNWTVAQERWVKGGITPTLYFHQGRMHVGVYNPNTGDLLIRRSCR